METNKQFPKDQLFDFEVLEQTEKGLDKNSLSRNLSTMAALVLHNFYVSPRARKLKTSYPWTNH